MTRPRFRRATWLGISLFLTAAAVWAQTSAPSVAADDPAVLPAEVLPRAGKSLLLDLTQTTAGLFAVGERGHILTSGDGTTWKQVEAPTRATLTSLASAEGQLWAGGHDGVILHSTDGGQTWQRQRVAPWSADDQDPTHGVPVMDLLFLDAKHGFAVGAYSLFLETQDAGVTWKPRRLAAPQAATAPPPDAGVNDQNWTFDSSQLQLGDEADPHFNAIVRTGSGGLLIAGERGAIFRSRDDGANWERVKFPYDGSMFGALGWDGEHVLVYGLRGNVYESDDLGGTWRKVETGVNANLMGGQALANGGAVLVGANGRILVRKDGASPFQAATFTNAAGETPTLAAVLAEADGRYVVAGDTGVDAYTPQSK